MREVAKSTRLRFGEFAADLTTCELFKHGTKIPLQDKPFQILILLLQRAKQLVSRQEIIRNVWPDTFVEGDLCLNVAMRRLRFALEDDASAPRFIETVGSHGYRFVAGVHGLRKHEFTPASRDRPRVAIFPLKPPAGAQPGYFCSTLVDVLITQLRRLNPPFTVITPEFTTERAPKGKATVSLCKRADADYALVGSVTEADGKVRVTIRLLNCQGQSCVWAESYIREGEDWFAIQEEIGRNIACALAQSVPMPLRPSLSQFVPQIAHEDYVHGCSLLSKLTEAGIERCIPLFEGAVRTCPEFARAWATLATSYCVQARLGMQPSRKAFPKVKACVEKSLQTEDVAEARTALAYYYFHYEHNWNAAEASLVRALAIDPTCPLAVGAYAQLLSALGRHVHAVEMMRRAREVDPYSGYTGVMFGSTLYYARDYEEALLQLQSATEIDISLWTGHMTMGMVLDRLGKTDKAIVEFRSAVEYSESGGMAKALLAYGLASAGDTPAATEILDTLLHLRQRRYFSPYWLAVIYAALGRRSEAFRWLEIAVEERCSWIVFVREDPKFDSLHGDTRFQAIVDAIKLHTPAESRHFAFLELQT
jgi:DNA-binding winged helix-turn-helix (wHTH) protein/Tfp pilus assembly protein PilF